MSCTDILCCYMTVRPSVKPLLQTKKLKRRMRLCFAQPVFIADMCSQLDAVLHVPCRLCVPMASFFAVSGSWNLLVLARSLAVLTYMPSLTCLVRVQFLSSLVPSEGPPAIVPSLNQGAPPLRLQCRPSAQRCIVCGVRAGVGHSVLSLEDCVPMASSSYLITMKPS